MYLIARKTPDYLWNCSYFGWVVVNSLLIWWRFWREECSIVNFRLNEIQSSGCCFEKGMVSFNQTLVMKRNLTISMRFCNIGYLFNTNCYFVILSLSLHYPYCIISSSKISQFCNNTSISCITILIPSPSSMSCPVLKKGQMTHQWKVNKCASI